MSKNKKSSQIRIEDSSKKITPCTMCNPKIYLKFSFAFVSHEDCLPEDHLLVKMWERMRWLSQEPYMNMFYKFGSNKQNWFELIPTYQIKKDVPESFRKIFPSETNEKYAVMRVYPAGSPNGTPNSRVIGMIRNTIFYIFFLDWKGNLYDHE